jgi:starvation-inducible DNA-binding protein
MTTTTTPHKSTQTSDAVAQALQEVLEGTYGLYLATHNYHWNVEGEKFVTLHTLFEGQYNELFLAVDLVAERIRALGKYALPFEGDNIIKISKMISNPLNKETDANLRADRMVLNLTTLTGDLINICRAAKEEALNAEDDETGSLIIERITAHQKALWMLESTLK